MTDEEKTLIIEALQPLINQRAYGLNSPCKVSVLHGNGQYRKEALTGDEEFFLQGMRPGKRSPIIFEFQPVDSRPWQHMEMGEDAFDYVVGLKQEVEGLLGVPFKDAGVALIRRKEAEKEEAERQRQEEIAKTYGDNELFGAF